MSSLTLSFHPNECFLMQTCKSTLWTAILRGNWSCSFLHFRLLFKILWCRSWLRLLAGRARPAQLIFWEIYGVFSCEEEGQVLCCYLESFKYYKPLLQYMNVLWESTSFRIILTNKGSYKYPLNCFLHIFLGTGKIFPGI